MGGSLWECCSGKTVVETGRGRRPRGGDSVRKERQEEGSAGDRLEPRKRVPIVEKERAQTVRRQKAPGTVVFEFKCREKPLGWIWKLRL